MALIQNQGFIEDHLLERFSMKLVFHIQKWHMKFSRCKARPESSASYSFAVVSPKGPSRCIVYDCAQNGS